MSAILEGAKVGDVVRFNSGRLGHISAISKIYGGSRQIYPEGEPDRALWYYIDGECNVPELTEHSRVVELMMGERVDSKLNASEINEAIDRMDSVCAGGKAGIRILIEKLHPELELTKPAVEIRVGQVWSWGGSLRIITKYRNVGFDILRPDGLVRVETSKYIQKNYNYVASNLNEYLNQSLNQKGIK